MFRKLRFQFIVTNLAIIAVLLAAITTGAYFYLQNNMIKRAAFFSSQLSMNLNSGVFPGYRNPGSQLRRGRQLPPPAQLGPKPPELEREPEKPIFFIRTTPGGAISFDSDRKPFARIQLAKLAKQVLKLNKDSGVVHFSRTRYYFSKTALTDAPGFLIVFQDLGGLDAIIRTGAAIGVICLLLALLGSLFMARVAIAPIQKAWRQQRDFIADASHELRTPVTIIRTSLEVVLENPQATVESQREWLNIVSGEIRRLAHLIDNLLFLARADSHQPLLEQQPFSLSQMAERAAEAFQPLAAAQGIRFSATIRGGATICGDETRIRQVIDILVENALRHTPPGGKIALTLCALEKRVCLKIADTGEGIAPEHLPKIFDRFYQVDNSRSKGQAGLGLSIAKSIIENHRGTIAAVSALGSGTTFTIHLPALPSD
ncbi:phospho-acceptor domain-containing protein [Hydrogenispora ethanolica]|uniref:histidine kinase n=1 Tax=Hydrogenispora ethanolica TaxID=1082276 RepID=A0A4R1SA35_HYDET|nr:ATP-binding protein [Hydrogenispora ethanolica]TCL76301.1 phospho-acceptor domain-containing protein [Hydrogenispora ethanolica]